MKTDRKNNLYLARLSCKIGRDAMDDENKLPLGVTATEYALYNLLYAVDEIAAHLQEKESEVQP